MPSPGALAAPLCHDGEVTQASSQAESLVKFPTGTPCSRGGPAKTMHHQRLADAVGSFLARRGPFLSGEGFGHASRGQRRGAPSLPALYMQEKGFALLPCLQILQSLNLQTE